MPVMSTVVPEGEVRLLETLLAAEPSSPHQLKGAICHPERNGSAGAERER
jgi:hypothetical protein